MNPPGNGGSHDVSEPGYMLMYPGSPSARCSHTTDSRSAGASTDRPRREPLVCFFTATMSWSSTSISVVAHTSPRVKPPGSGGSCDVSELGHMSMLPASPSTRCSHDTTSRSAGLFLDGPRREPLVCFFTATVSFRYVGPPIPNITSLAAHTSPRVKPPGSGGSRDSSMSAVTFVKPG
eukprot:scaffold109443_cov72-Phaeocystis_antarctica.AAC.5